MTAEHIPVDAAAVGRQLLEPVTAIQPMMHFSASAMDGWAVSGSEPWILLDALVEGERLYPGQAVSIVTGGQVPPGAQAVLRSESGQEGLDGEGLPVLRRGPAAKPGEPRNGQHIRGIGEEAPEGELLVAEGTVLSPVHVALACLAGLDEVPVRARPRVGLLYTGDEVISSGLPAPGQVRDVFGPQLPAVVRLLGGAVTRQQRLPDDLSRTEDALASTDAELLITTGGTAGSAADQIRTALQRLGAQILVPGVSVRPGSPALLARLPTGHLVLGLPGNPLAAFMSLSTLGEPLFAGFAGRELPPLAEVETGEAFEPLEGRTRLIPYRERYGFACPVPFAGAAMLRGLASARGIMVIPEQGAAIGESVAALPLPWMAHFPSSAGD